MIPRRRSTLIKGAFQLLALLCALTLHSTTTTTNNNSNHDGGPKTRVFVDAINYAEPKFDDLLNQKCPAYTCPHDYIPVPRSRLKFKSGGCHSFAGAVTTLDDTETPIPYQQCCDILHACYQVCGMVKTKCDAEFELCSATKCDASDESCHRKLKSTSTMIQLGGCREFELSQKKSCECVATLQQAEKKRAAALRYFYKKVAPDNVDKSEELAAKADTPSRMAGLMLKLLIKYPESITVNKNEHNDQMDLLEDQIKEAKKMAKEAKEADSDENDETNDSDESDDDTDDEADMEL
mmetsp:Transcript_24905/g.69241  ORF Transcript_24905/g.69241 Transcript_24905/m.69241 type:complete len:294 (-) Transcript_24905:246-1127(-)